jgi:hypothetical protein
MNQYLGLTLRVPRLTFVIRVQFGWTFHGQPGESLRETCARPLRGLEYCSAQYSGAAIGAGPESSGSAVELHATALRRVYAREFLASVGRSLAALLNALR